jgi:hypothetical protein
LDGGRNNLIGSIIVLDPKLICRAVIRIEALSVHRGREAWELPLFHGHQQLRRILRNRQCARGRVKYWRRPAERSIEHLVDLAGVMWASPRLAGKFLRGQGVSDQGGEWHAMAHGVHAAEYPGSVYSAANHEFVH